MDGWRPEDHSDGKIARMILQLDPRHPLVWRSPTSLQFGIDDPQVRLEEVTGSQERMIAALVVGIARSGLDLIARSSGADAQAVDDLLRSLRGALVRGAQVLAPAAIVVAGVGETAERMSSLLSGAGITPHPIGADTARAGETADPAVIVAHFVVDPALHGVWLRRDIPHLPVVLGDVAVRVGPFVEPGTGPCLYCLERHRIDDEPAWPAMAAQLWGRRSPLDSGLVAAEVAAAATRMILERFGAGAPPRRASSLLIDAVSGTVTRRVWQAHPECGCAALPGSGMPGAEPNVSARPRRTTGAADVVPG